MRENSKVSYVESPKPKKSSNLDFKVLFITFILGFIGGMYLIIGIYSLVDEKRAEFTDRLDNLVCEQLYNDTKDKHTALCCDSCKNVGLKYSYDSQYQNGGQLVDDCFCLDQYKLEVKNIWA